MSLPRTRRYNHSPREEVYPQPRHVIPPGTKLPRHLREGIPSPQPQPHEPRQSYYPPRYPNQVPTPPYSRYDPYARHDHHQHPPHPRRVPATNREPPLSAGLTNRSGTQSHFQPSRGAQRDARSSQKYQSSQRPAQPMSSSSSPTTHGAREYPHQSVREYRSALRRQAQSAQHAQDRQHQQQHRQRQEQEQQHAKQVAIQRQQLQHATNHERIRMEQQNAISAARKLHAKEIEQSQARAQQDEYERKVRRIQIQVFVHARATACRWKDCPAVLNSWALLEKHVYHAHLHPNLDDDAPRECLWEDCHQKFETTEELHKHVLIPHMRPFSARCPFNCLYEGDHFTSLMAHVERRHPKATPDDFVPGLIHFKPAPESLPPPPPLPEHLYPQTTFLWGKIPGYYGDTTSKIKKLVWKGCFSGKHPRKECYVEKKAAGAAISALVENSRRISLVPPDTPTDGVILIDVNTSAEEAKDQAKEEIVAEILKQIEEDETTSESGLSDGSEYKVKGVERRLGMEWEESRVGGGRPGMGNLRGVSEDAEDSRYKRSQRLKEKLALGEGGGSETSSASMGKQRVASTPVSPTAANAKSPGRKTSLS